MRFKKGKNLLEGKLLSKINRFEPSETILLFSDPRGGSTWLSEVLLKATNSAVVWEPLHPRIKSEFRKLDLGASSRRYIPEDVSWPEAKKAFQLLFSGKLLYSNSFFLSKPWKFIIAKRLLVKICRGNGMIPYITKNFNFSLKPIYLVRHPFAVVASQLRHGSWDKIPDRFELPKSPFPEFYFQHKEFLKSLNSREEVLTAVWCLINSVPLNHARNNKDWITIHYENLLLNPEIEMKRIFNIWGMDYPDNIKKNIAILSKTAKPNQFEENKINQLEKWKDFFSEDQLFRMGLIMDYFKISVYSRFKVVPENYLNK